MPIYQIQYNDYDEIWEAFEANWEDDTRVLNAVNKDTYGLANWTNEMQTDYGTFVEADSIKDAFNQGVDIIEAKIKEEASYAT